jgi:tetratricopeptide (TPR) repeat protein
VREFALEQLDALGEAAEVCRRHAAFFTRLADHVEEQARGADQPLAVERLREEHDNLRAALQWAIDRGEAAVAVRLSGALGWFWDIRSYIGEGRRWLAAALALLGDVEPVSRARALTSAGILAGHSDYPQARELFEQGIALYRASTDRHGLAYALSYFGRMLRFQGDYAAARASLAEALALFQELGDQRGAAYASYNLARLLAQQGDDEAARPMFAASLAQFSQIGDVWGQALAHLNLGRIAYRRGDPAEARASYARSLILFEQIGDVWGQALAHCKLGWAAYRLGNEAARTHFAESLAVFNRVQYAEGVADALTGMGAVSLRAGQSERAARLFGAAAGARSSVDALLTTDDHDDTGWRAALREQLGDAALEAAWRAGAAAPLDDTIAQVLTDKER